VRIKTQEFFDAMGRKHSVGLLGIKPSDQLTTVRHGIFESVWLSINKTWELTVLTYTGLWRMITRQISVKESVTGPLGIFFIASKAVKVGMIAVLHLMAVLSVSLAIFNLLPFPVLDGGHIIFLALEKLRDRALSIKVEQVITQLGFMLIIALALFVTYNDIMRILSIAMAKEYLINDVNWKPDFNDIIRFFGEKISKIFH